MVRHGNVSIVTVALDAGARERVAAAARELGSPARVSSVASLEEAGAIRPTGEHELLILGAGLAAEHPCAASAAGADGLPRWAVLSFTPEVASSSPATLAAVMRLTLQAHESAREAARGRGDLLTIARRISHEIRSPLGCILTSAEVLREELSEGAPDLLTVAQPILDSAHEVMELLDRLSLVTRASASPVATSNVAMEAVVWAARERLASRLQAVGAQITESPDWPEVSGVRDWLERIWLNLLANALDHAGPEPRIELGWTPQNGALKFFVRDTGPGVPPEFQRLLFRPFHRLHEKDSARGLGLALVDRLVALQGGQVGFEPVTPRGACFYFVLPKAETA